MEDYWINIKKEINNQFGISNNTQWTNDNLDRLQLFVQSKVMSVVMDDDNIASAFFEPKELKVFIKLDRKQKEKYFDELPDSYKVAYTLNRRTFVAFLFEDNAPGQKRTRNILSIFIYGKLYEASLLEFTPTESSKRSEKSLNLSINKLTLFNKTIWLVYYYHYDEELKTGFLGRAILEIDDENNVKLKNVPDKTATDFHGHLELEVSTQHLAIKLWSKETAEKYLYIRVFIGAGTSYPILLGMYINNYGDNAIVAGTIILELASENNNHNLNPARFSFDEAVLLGLNESIISFLQKREYNFIKAPSGILTLEKLKRWLAEKQNININRS